MGQVIRRIVLYLLYFIIVFVLVVALILGFRSDNNEDIAQPTGQSTQAGSGTSQPKTATSPATGISQPSATSPATNGSTPSAASPQPTASSSELTNSGPGDIMVPFVIASAMGYGLFRYRLVKRIGAA
jgi:cytoskeletal protein RodZ